MWRDAYRRGFVDAMLDDVVATVPRVPLAIITAVYSPPDDKPHATLLLAPHNPKYGRDGLPARKPTRLQLEAIRLYADGLGMKAIASKLWVTEQTVSNRVQRAYQRTGARTLPHLVAVCLRKGWIA